MGRCHRFPPTVIPDHVIKKVEMMKGKPKTLIEALTHDSYGVFPMTGGSTWCGEWTQPRHEERELLIEDEKKRQKAFEEFAKRHGGDLHRTIP